MERYVQTVKNGLLSSSRSYLDLGKRLDSFLMAYRSTPHTVTEETPSQRFLGRTIFTKIDLVKPKLDVLSVHNVNCYRKELRELKPGDKIVSRVFNSKNKWISGTVVQQIGSKLFKVRINGVIAIRHIDQIKKSFTCLDDADDAWDYTVPINSNDGNNDANDSTRRYPVRCRHPIHRYGFDND